MPDDVDFLDFDEVLTRTWVDDAEEEEFYGCEKKYYNTIPVSEMVVIECCEVSKDGGITHD